MITALTWLFVPADRPDRVDKAMNSAADVVIVDLEDAVAPDRKVQALVDVRPVLSGEVAIERANHGALQMRINGAGSPRCLGDLRWLNGLLPGVGAVLPKSECPDQVAELAAALPGRSLQLMIESALGIERAYDLARCSDRIAWIALGEADLRADLRLFDPDDDQGLAFARSRVTNAAAAAGLRPPPMSVYPHLDDPEGLRRFSQNGRALGFLGGMAIHPNQLSIIADAYRPSPSELARARSILASAADRSGSGGLALEDGTFVDAAVIAQAQRTVELADDTSSLDPLRDNLGGLDLGSRSTTPGPSGAHRRERHSTQEFRSDMD